MRNLGLTRHISLEDEYIDKLQPYVVRHNGNLGAAIRDLIKEAGKNENRKKSSAIDDLMLNWILSEIGDRPIPHEILNEILDPSIINSMDELEKYINQLLAETNWRTNVNLKYDDDMAPNEILVEINGDQQKIKFIASILTQYLIIHSIKRNPIGIKNITNEKGRVRIEMSGSHINVQHNLEEYFGCSSVLLRTIKSQPDFWNSIFNKHLVSNYNMVTLHRNYFEDMLDGKIPSWENMVENHAKRPIKDIPLKELLKIIKEVFEISRVVEKVEINKDTLILFHNYRDKKAIENLRKSFHSLFEANGHMYDARATANIVVMTHRKDVGIKINEIVESMNNTKNGLNQNLIIFMGFLNGLKEIPDIHLSLTSLGKRIGSTLMHEYEMDNQIISWTLEDFKEAMQDIDTRLHRVSEWKLDGKDLVYTIRKCSIAGDIDSFDDYICHTVRETFKGALNHVFGSKAQLCTNHLLAHGDNFCEVVIKLL